MAYDIRSVRNITDLIGYFSENLNWAIDIDDFDDIEDISYDFEAEDIGLKEENFAKISSLRQLQPLVDGQQWGIFCIEFDSNKFEVSALRKILSKFVPKRRSMIDHAVWEQQDLLFICNWGEDNNRTIGIAHFEDQEKGLPQIKMISCAPALEDFTQIKVFEDRLAQLAWPKNTSNIDAWREAWSNAFASGYRQTIQDSSTLTIQLAAEAQNIRNRILSILDVETKNGYVHLLYDKFKDTLIHDMTEQQFADMYAQTVVYGLFSARCMDSTQDDFSAAEAIDCIPSTNPFLKSLMRECLGSQGNNKLSFDELEIGNVVDLLLHTKTDEIIKDFNRQTGGGREDPVIHFYEEFLTAYDKSQKVQRGVYYTPQPVVNFIVRAVDSILKTEFGYEDGLASTETKKIKVMRDSRRRVNGYKTQVEEQIEVPAVQILDPATGTGTFLRQTILQIYENFQQKHKGEPKDKVAALWNKYVDESLLPRLNGFELMMAPYAVAHMKLAMVLKDTGYDFSGKHRLNVFLTNSLEKPGNSDNQLTLFDDPLALESVEANKAKKNNGVNIIIGNPPYSGISSNSSEWITSMIEDYKYIDGVHFGERKHWLQDDYVKFVRLCESLLEERENGVLAFINNHAFLDNPTFRCMRYHLLQTFDSIYEINLHGNSLVGEKNPNGGTDENVFDIQQGVSINIFIKRGSSKSKRIASVQSYDLFGSRAEKYEWLSSHSLDSISWKALSPVEPYYFYVEKDLSSSEEYNNGFAVQDLFAVNVMGITTARDFLVIDMNKQALLDRIKHFCDMSYSDEQIREEFFPGKKAGKYLPGDTRGWQLTRARKLIANNDHESLIKEISYRPFDTRYIYYCSDMVDWNRENVMKHFLYGPNVGLSLIRINRDDLCTALVSNRITDKTILSSKDNANVFPLFLYDTDNFVTPVKPNFNAEAIHLIENCLGLRLTNSESFDPNEHFDAYSLLDYMYAWLYSPEYRIKFKDLLQSEFPKIPYPKSPKLFWALADLGSKLRVLHLGEKDLVNAADYEFCGAGDNTVSKAIFENGRIKINNTQYFNGVSEEMWNFYIAAYQPLQKWMKDRKGMQLSERDILEYQYIIAALNETSAIMKQIDEVINQE